MTLAILFFIFQNDDCVELKNKMENVVTTEDYIGSGQLRWWLGDGTSESTELLLGARGTSPNMGFGWMAIKPDGTKTYVTAVDKDGNNLLALSNHNHDSVYAKTSHTHDHSNIKGMTTNRALISNGSGVLSESAVTSTELGYLDGVTSNVQTQLNGKAASNHTHDASKITGNFQGKTLRWSIADDSYNKYAELRRSGSSPTAGLSFVYNNGSTNVFNNIYDKDGNFLLADKEYIDDQFDTLLGVGGHWNSQEKYYKSINIKYGGDAANYGNICFLLVIGCVFLINIPQPTSSFKNCKYTKILDPTESSYVINPSSCQVINDGSLKRLKMTFASNINMSVNVMPLSAPIKITEIYSATS